MPKKVKPRELRPGPQPKFGETMKRRLIVMLTVEDDLLVAKAVEKSGKSRSTWGRDVIMAAAKAS